MENNNESKNNFSEVFTGENGKKGVKLPNGRVIIPANYDEFAYTYSDFIWDTRPYVAIKDGKYGLVRPDGKGTELTPFVYEIIAAVPEIPNYFLYKKEKGERFGIMAMDGREVTPCNLDSYSCDGQTVYFRSGNHQGLWQWVIDELQEPIYDDIEVLDIDEPTLFTLNGEKGYVKVEDHSFIPESLKETMDEDAWHDMLIECFRDQYLDILD